MKYQKTVPLNQVVMTIYRNRQGSFKARFRRRTFQEQYIEINTSKARRLNQLGTPASIWNGYVVLFAQLGREFRLWVSDFGTVLIQTPNFLCTEPYA